MMNIGKKLKIFGGIAIALFLGFAVFKMVSAVTTMDPTNHWAWNDQIGWIDFYSTNNANVYYDRLEGYASSSVGYIALNCNTTPNGDVCSGDAGNWKIINTAGTLSGWAWNDQIGWISFNCSDRSICATSNYSVTIDSNGYFNGWAWNDLAGWISFNCGNSGTNGCTSPGVNYKVINSWAPFALTGWLTSSTYDTCEEDGAAFDSIVYTGTKPAGTAVYFQFATSNSSDGPWSYAGPDGTSGTYYNPAGSGIPVVITDTQHNNKRYFRYKIFIETDVGRQSSPTVTGVRIVWVP
ncbi:MAG: hypothetical protein PHP03_01145 [Candidatus Pacebacteria bacterium]|nr:hypothetical protein [Candidatus Paceibacterota bacterium]